MSLAFTFILTSLLSNHNSPFAFPCETALAVFASPSTPESDLIPYQRLRSDLSCDIDFPYIESIPDLPTHVPRQSYIAIDLLYSKFLSLGLQEFLRDRPLVILSANLYSFPQQYSLYFAVEDELAALIAVAQKIGLSRFCVFLPAGTREYSDLIDSKPELEIAVEFVSAEASLESLKLAVHKQALHYGFTSFLVVLPRATTEALLQAVKEEGTVTGKVWFLVSTQGGYCLIESSRTIEGIADIGTVFLVRKGCEVEMRNPSELLLCEIRYSLSSKKLIVFTIVNYRKGKNVAVGSVRGGKVTLFSPILSNDEEKQVFSYQTLVISFNNGTVNPRGITNTGEIFDYLGVQIAIQTINNNLNLLPYHNMQIFNVSLGLFEFDADWAMAQLSNFTRDNLGIAMLCGEYSEVTIGVYSLLSKLSYNLPQIGSSNTTPMLSSISQFPLFARVVMSDRYLSVLYGRVMTHYDWKRIAIVYLNDTWSTSLYSLILAETARIGVSILNSNTTRMLSPSPSSSEYLASFQDIIDSKCRIVILILHGDTLYTGIATLYDLGMRRGDILFLATEWMDTNLFEQENAEMHMKIAELCNGAIQFYPASLVGDIGRGFANEYEAVADREPSMYSCFYYDSVYILAHALDYMITYGIDYKSPNNVMKSVRSTRFKGCSGLVTLDEDSNYRSPMIYYIWNAQVDSEGKYAIVKVGTYDPAGLVLFNFTEAVRWPDGTSIIPTDMRGQFGKCPFDETEARVSVLAVFVMGVTITGLSLVLIIITGWIWVKQWNLPAVPLLSRAEISFDDYLFFASIPIDAFQYANMGPEAPSWSKYIQLTTGVFAVQMDTLIDLRQGTFWSVLQVTYGVIFLWVALLIAQKARICKKSHWMQARIDDLAVVVLPLIGNIGFLPILSILLSVFQCTKSVTGSGFQSIYLSPDCYEQCWTVPHTYYVSISVLCLFLYIPAAIWLKPLWQEQREYLHIHTSPAYLMAKSMYQIAIVACENSIKGVNPTVHGVVFAILTIIFCIVTVVRRPFGYARPNFWHTLSLICVLWFLILSVTTASATEGNPLVYLGTFLGGVGLLVGAGVLWQWVAIPSKLYRREAVRMVDLFKFMFSRGGEYLYVFNRNNREEIFEGDGESHARRRISVTIRSSVNT